MIKENNHLQDLYYFVFNFVIGEGGDGNGLIKCNHNYGYDYENKYLFDIKVII